MKGLVAGSRKNIFILLLIIFLVGCKLNQAEMNTDEIKNQEKSTEYNDDELGAYSESTKAQEANVSDGEEVFDSVSQDVYGLNREEDLLRKGDATNEKSITKFFEQYEDILVCEQAAIKERIMIDTSGLNIRKNPSATSDKVGTAYDGESYVIDEEVIGEDGRTWYRIDFPYSRPNDSGYVHGDYCIKIDKNFNYYSRRMPYEFINAKIYRDHDIIKTSRYRNYDWNQNIKSFNITLSYDNLQAQSPYLVSCLPNETIERIDAFFDNKDSGFIKHGRFYALNDYQTHYDNLLSSIVDIETLHDKDKFLYIKTLDYKNQYEAYTDFEDNLYLRIDGMSQVLIIEDVDDYVLSENYLLYYIEDVLNVLNLETGDLQYRVEMKSLDDFYVQGGVLYYYNGVDNYALSDEQVLFLIEGKLFARELSTGQEYFPNGFQTSGVVFDDTGAYIIQEELGEYRLYQHQKGQNEFILNLELASNRYITSYFQIGDLIYCGTGTDLNTGEMVFANKYGQALLDR